MNELDEYVFYKQLKAFHKDNEKALTKDVSKALKNATALPIEKWQELIHLFPWNASPEGHDYWRVRDKAL